MASHTARRLWEIGRQSISNYGLKPVTKLKLYGLVRGGVHQLPIYLFYWKFIVNSPIEKLSDRL